MANYRILWVDEEVSNNFVKGAALYGLEVEQFTSWDLGKAALSDKSLDWDAVILDGNCVLKEGEGRNSDFLYQAVSEMKSVMVERGISIPWYVLSSGSADDFEKTLSRVSMGEREKMTDKWGRLYYHKTKEEVEALFQSICQAASQSVKNRIRFLYADVFDTIDRYFDRRAEEVMMTIMTALHFPEENRKFDPVAYYTQMRRILEYLFRAANKIGALPDEMMQDDKINLTNSSCYLDGQEVKVGRNLVLQVDRDEERIFPPIIAGIVKKIINIANKQTHTTDMTQEEEEILRDYYKTVGSSNMLFGYALQLCDVIVWFGTWAKSHPDPLANRKMCFRKQPARRSYTPAARVRQTRPPRPGRTPGKES